MTTSYSPEHLVGHTAVDSSGDKIGKIAQVYLDDRTGEPAWVAVSTGLFGTRESLAPLHGADVTGDDIVLSVTKEQIKGAPNIETDGHVDESDEQQLYDYYSGVYTSDTTSGPDTDDAMTRSEERLHVGTESVQTGRARLRKYVVTENVTQTVPVSHEEVRVEREPITDANVGAATDGPAISEDEHEVTLHAERPVVAKEALPVERVRMDTETVTDQATVDESVRKEQIEVEGDSDSGAVGR